MPSYDFRCPECGETLTVTASIKEISNFRPTCLVCKGDMRRVFNPANIVFKGEGWACKDKKPKKKTTESAAS